MASVKIGDLRGALGMAHRALQRVQPQARGVLVQEDIDQAIAMAQQCLWPSAVDSEQLEGIRPTYYAAGSNYEPINVIRAWGSSFALGNVLKYIARAGKKCEGRSAALTAVEDLKKAQTYLALEIQHLEDELAQSEWQDQIDAVADIDVVAAGIDAVAVERSGDRTEIDAGPEAPAVEENIKWQAV